MSLVFLYLEESFFRFRRGYSGIFLPGYSAPQQRHTTTFSLLLVQLFIGYINPGILLLISSYASRHEVKPIKIPYTCTRARAASLHTKTLIIVGKRFFAESFFSVDSLDFRLHPGPKTRLLTSKTDTKNIYPVMGKLSSYRN
jgi:hypothetical protein